MTPTHVEPLRYPLFSLLAAFLIFLSGYRFVTFADEQEGYSALNAFGLLLMLQAVDFYVCTGWPAPRMFPPIKDVPNRVLIVTRMLTLAALLCVAIPLYEIYFRTALLAPAASVSLAAFAVVLLFARLAYLYRYRDMSNR